MHSHRGDATVMDVQVFVCGDDKDVERGKPAPDIYLCAARRLGVSPASCVAFEDAPSGIESAVAAGMRAVIAIPDARLNRDDITALGTTVCLQTIEEFIPESVGLPPYKTS